MSSVQVRDLSPLAGMSLEKVALAGAPVADLSPLRGMPLKILNISGTRVENLDALAGMPLEVLHFATTRVSDVSWVADMPLKELAFNGCHYAVDLTPVKSLTGLERLTIPGKSDDFGFLRQFPRLKHLHRDWDRWRLTAEQFWARHDAEVARIEGIGKQIQECNPEQKPLQFRFTVTPEAWCAIDLSGNPQLRDIGPLLGLRMGRLDLSGSAVTDLQPLARAPLDRLILDGCEQLKDLSPLTNCGHLRGLILPRHIEVDVARTQLRHPRVLGHATAENRLKIALRDWDRRYDWQGKFESQDGEVVRVTFLVPATLRIEPFLACPRLEEVNGLEGLDPMTELAGRAPYEAARRKTRRLIERFSEGESPWAKRKVQELRACLDSPSRLWIDQLLTAGRLAEAEDLLKVMLPLCRTAERKCEFGLLVARVQRGLGRPDQAERAVKALLSRRDLPASLRAPALLERARVLNDRGDRTGALAALREIAAPAEKGALVPGGAVSLAHELEDEALAEELQGAAFPEGCVLRLTFDPGTVVERDGRLRARDESGRGVHGTVHGAAPAQDGARHCLRFDGVDDHVEVNGFKRTTTTITFVARIKGWQAASFGGIIFHRVRDQHATGMNFAADDRLHYHWPGAGGDGWRWNAGPRIPKDEWATVAIAIAPQSATAYVAAGDDLQAGVHETPHPPREFERLTIGWDRNAAHRRFRGLMDEVLVFDRTLSRQEIAALHAGWEGRPGVAAAAPSALPGCVLNLSFDGSTLFRQGGRPAARDLSGHGHAAQFHGAAPEECEFGGAVRFRGGEDHVLIPTLRNPDKAFTYALRFKPDKPLTGASPRMDLLYAVGEEHPRPALLFNKSGSGAVRLFARLDGAEFNGTATRTTSWPAAWAHVVFTWDGAAFCVYVDGRLENRVERAGARTTTTGLRISHGGQGQWSRAFEGLVSEVQVFSRSISQEEVQLLCKKRGVAGRAWAEARVKAAVAGLEARNPEQKPVKARFVIEEFGAIRLDLSGNPGLRDVSPLSGLPLARLDLSGSAVTDLSPLSGLPLARLDLSGSAVTDLSPLAKCAALEALLLPRQLDVDAARGQAPGVKFVAHGGPAARLHLALKDCNPDYDFHGVFGVADGKVVGVRLFGAGIRDVSPVKELPLKRFAHMGTVLPDFTPLLACRDLEEVRCLAIRNPMEELLGQDSYRAACDATQALVDKLSRGEAPWFRKQVEELKKSLAAVDKRWVEDLLSRGEVEEAKLACDAMLPRCESDSDKREFRLFSARIARQAGRLDEAAAAIKDLLGWQEAAPLFRARVMLEMALLQRSQGKPDSAIEALRRIAAQEEVDLATLRVAAELAKELGEEGLAGEIERRSVPSGCVLLLTFDHDTFARDKGRLTTRDLSGAGNDGVLCGAQPVRDEGRECLRFDGRGAYVDCGADASLDLSEGLTVAAWVKHGGGNGHIVNRGGGWEAPGYSLWWYGSGIRVELQNEREKRFLDNPTPSDGKWRHVVFTWEAKSKTIKLFIDGEQMPRTTSFTGPIGRQMQKLNVGRNAGKGEGFWNGLIDDVAVFNRALSPEEIALLRASQQQGVTAAALSSALGELKTRNPEQKPWRASHGFCADATVRLDLAGNPQLRDIAPLARLPLSRLDLSKTGVVDLTALKGAPLTQLLLTGCEGLRDLSPLKECRRLQVLVLPEQFEIEKVRAQLPRVRLIGRDTVELRLHLALAERNPRYSFSGRFTTENGRIVAAQFADGALEDFTPLLGCGRLARVEGLSVGSPMEALVGRDRYAHARKKTLALVERLAAAKAPWFRGKSEELKASLARPDRRWVDLLLAQGGTEEARSVLDAMLPLCRAGEEKRELRLLSASVNRALGELEKARNEVTDVLRASALPDRLRHEALFELAAILAARGDTASALAALRKILAAKPADSEVLRRVSGLAAGLEDKDLAKQAGKAAELSGCVLLLTFDADALVQEGGKPIAKDRSVTASHGLVRGATPVRDAGREALSFDGSSMIDCGHVEALSPAGSFTVSAWAKVAVGSSDYRAVVSNRKGGVSPEQGYILYAGSNGAWQFWLGAGATRWQTLSGSKAVLGEWTHVVGVFDRFSGPDANGLYTGAQRLFVNGEEVAGSPARGSVYLPNTTPGRPLRVGAGGDHPAEFFFKGLIGEVRVYARALETEEIRQLAGKDEALEVE